MINLSLVKQTRRSGRVQPQVEDGSEGGGKRIFTRNTGTPTLGASALILKKKMVGGATMPLPEILILGWWKKLSKFKAPYA